jgi:Transposase protein
MGNRSPHHLTDADYSDDINTMDDDTPRKQNYREVIRDLSERLASHEADPTKEDLLKTIDELRERIASDDTPRKRKLSSRISDLQTNVKRKREKARYNYQSLRKEMERDLSREEVVQAAEVYLDGAPLTLLRMQLLHKQNQRWREDEKQFAMAANYKSPGLYRDLREKFGFKLPSKSTLEKWQNVLDMQPGLCPPLMENIRLKMSNMHKRERQCVLLFDEMSIKKDLQFAPQYDLIEGFEDLGEIGRTAAPGTHILVFMIRGLNFNYKLPIAYFVASTVVKAAALLKLVHSVLDSLREAGAIVKSHHLRSGPE